MIGEGSAWCVLGKSEYGAIDFTRSFVLSTQVMVEDGDMWIQTFMESSSISGDSWDSIRIDL